MPDPTKTPEIRPDARNAPTDYLTGSMGAALLRDGARIERRRTWPCAGWYAIYPKVGALGPFPTARAARGRR